MYQTFLPLKTVGNIIISLNKHICSKCLLCTGPYLDGSRLGKKYFSWVSRRRKNWWLNMMVFSIKGMSKVVFYNTTKFESLNCRFRKSSLLESLSNLQISLIIWFIFQEKKKSKSPKVFFFLWYNCNGSPLQYSCLESPMDGGAWWAAGRGDARSRTRLNDFTFAFHLHALEKEMATHSSVLGWRIPGTGEPGGLPSMGSHRVGHDWSNLAATAAASLSLLVYSKGRFVIHLLAIKMLYRVPWRRLPSSCEFKTWKIF